MSDRDDETIGTILTRREVLAMLGAAGAGALLPGAAGAAAGRLVLAGAIVPACVVRPAQTEGPYYVDTKLNRSDIRSDPTDGKVYEGIPLEVAVRVSRLDGTSCAPYAGAIVDLWQCDAVGVYSGVRDMNSKFDTTGKQFLRGHQRTGADGVARFQTIWPGWYEGRTPHLHFKVRTEPDAARGREFVSQLYFEDAASDAIYAKPPYNANVQRRVRNAGDGIFRRGGEQLMLAVTPKGAGFSGTFDLGLSVG